jgi:hydroxyacylglutathione hydrolase
MINITPIPAFNDNYIWALHDAESAVLVDPGDASPARAWLEERALKLTAILCTHHHRDHVGGICQLEQLYNAPVYGPQHEIIPCLNHALGEGMRVEIAEPHMRLEVLDIFGHTRGHIAYLMSDPHGADALFCGDTLFGCGCGRLFEGTAAQLYGSLQRLARLPDDTQVYCAHEYTEANIRFALVCEPGNAALRQRQSDAAATRARGLPTLPSSIALELATNPFLRCDQPEIIHSVEQHIGHKLVPSDQQTTFAALREWRNGF